MATLASILPRPTQVVEEEHALFKRAAPQAIPEKDARKVPPYGQRHGWIPRNVEDFADGGAFPEIHVAQYPLDMGRKKSQSSSSSAIVPVQYDATGRVKNEAVLGSKDLVLFSQYSDLVEKRFGEEELARPDDDVVREATEKTKAAIEKVVNVKIQAAQPSNAVQEKAAPTFIRYTPAQQSASHNSGAEQRIIRMVEMPKDPLEPPKFKHKKVPKGPGSPPVPVMHSPPRKVTVKDQQMWKIPPCISNWKNAKGYTIPLDKRLAADGRDLQETTINDKFAKLSESLYIAERNARDEVSKRTLVQKKLMMREKEKKEEMLRRLAQEARAERSGAGAPAGGDREAAASSAPSGGERDRDRRGGGGGGRSDRDHRDRDRDRDGEDKMHDVDDEDEEASRTKADRDRIREERRRDRDRDLRLEAAGKKTKLLRDEERDISEKIALGQAAPQPSTEALYDTRLFNQSQGMDSGFGGEDSYNVYSKPLFSGSSANALYRPKRAEETESVENILKSSDKFRPDRGFQGTERAADAKSDRSGPVEFEKEEADPFGLDEFLNQAKKGGSSSSSSSSSGRGNALDKIGQRGHMHAASSDSRGISESGGSKRKSMDFESSRDSRR